MTHIANLEKLIPLKFPKYGITEAKKNEIDSLELQVVNAQHEVEQLQAIVNSLQEKSVKFEGFLAQAKADFDNAISNEKSLGEVHQDAKQLEDNSKTASTEMTNAKLKSNTLSTMTKKVIDELIYSAEVINKLASLIMRKKALNPLISDELVAMVAKAGDDANNAVALSLIAMKSSIAAYTSNVESDAIARLEYLQSRKFHYVLNEGSEGTKSLTKLLTDSLIEATGNHASAMDANQDTLNQLNAATINLNKANIKLSSLQLSLAAAKSAALAS